MASQALSQQQANLSPTEFASLVTAVTSAFGDPTRRDMYLFVHADSEGHTAAEVAEATGLHANVARHHLDKLVSGGYLEVSHRPSAKAGRPAKVYRATQSGLRLDFGVGHDDILVTLLGKALSRLPAEEAEELAEEVGVEFGRRMAESTTTQPSTEGRDATQRSFRSALHVVADALSAHGFAAHAERENNELRLVSSHCPFGDVAVEHPVICAVDRGMVKGMLGVLYGDTAVELTRSIPDGNDDCVTTIADPAP